MIFLKKSLLTSDFVGAALLLLLAAARSSAVEHSHIRYAANAGGDAPAQARASGSKLEFPDNSASSQDSARRGLRGWWRKKWHRKGGDCDPANVNLADYPQWQAEEGYWIGEYSFYQADGTPNVSPDWPYPYASYRGFITGNVEGNAYRQRNVFLYPPESTQECQRRQDDNATTVVGDGECGVNGNSLVFFADQVATTCSGNKELGGDIEGTIPGGITTTTEVIGDDNALLYQVFFDPGTSPKSLIQSQLTTITTDPATGTTYRTRTAQSFNFFPPKLGAPSNASFYRERKVTKDEFYATMQETIAAYKILESDVCLRDGFSPTRDPVDGYTAGFDQCTAHLESSFAL